MTLLDPLALRALEALGLPDSLAYAALTPDLRIERASLRFCEYCGWDLSSIAGRALSEVLDEADGVEDSLAAVGRGEAPSFELRRIMREPPGGAVTFATLLVVPRLVERPGAGLLVVIQDTSQAGRLEQLLNQQRTDLAELGLKLMDTADVLRQRNQDLDSFSHTVAHDLKAPLTVIVGYTNIIRKDMPETASERVHKSLRQIEATAFMMSSIIHNLLLLAQLRDTSEVITRVEMRPVIEWSLERLKSQIERRGVTVDIASDLPPVMGYGPWIEEVIANLVDNAIKYIGTENPAPRVAILTRRDGDMVAYGVRDNGIGITPENQTQLFEMFTRFDTEQAEGFGLGLAIVGRIVAKLRGEVGVESESGRGSTFWMKLPAAGPE